MIQAVVLAALLAGVAFLIARLVPGSGARLDHLAPGWLAAAVGAELLACLSYAAFFHGVFSTGAYRLRPLRSAEIAVGELGAFAVVPTGAGGPALRIWALLRSGMPFGVLMVRTVVHFAIFNIPYILAAVLLGTTAALGLGPGHAKAVVALAPIGVVLVTAGIAAGAAVLDRRLGGEPEPGWRGIGRAMLRAVPEGMRQLPARLRRPQLLLVAAGYWAGDFGVLAIAFHALHGSAPVGVIALAYMLGQLGNTLPLPGGVGGVEPIMLGVLTASGIDAGLGAAAIVVYRFVSLGLQAILGAAAVAGLTAALGRPRLGGGENTRPAG